MKLDYADFTSNSGEKDFEAIRLKYSSYEKKLREIFAQNLSAVEVSDPYVLLLSVHELPECSLVARNLSKDKIPHIVFPLKKEHSTPVGAQRIAGKEEFNKNWRVFTYGALDAIEWANVVAAGGAVQACLSKLNLGISMDERRGIFRKNYDSCDIDLFIYGLDSEAAKKKMVEIYNQIIESSPLEVKAIRTQNTCTIISQHPFRQVQIILRLYKSPAEVVMGFDVDSSSVCYNGKNVFVTPRAYFAHILSTNFIDMSRRSPTYEARLAKYASRGFQIYVDGFSPERVDPQIYERGFNNVYGLARLLVFEALTDQEARLQFKEIQRTRRLRPDHPHRGSYKDASYLRRGDLHASDLESSDYSTVFIPYGPKYTVERCIKLLDKKDRLMNNEWSMRKRKVTVHQHPVFHGTMTDILLDCCLNCPPAKTPDEVIQQEGFVKGCLKFVEQDPGRQAIGSFHPITDEDWECQAYIRADRAGMVALVVAGDSIKIKEFVTINPNFDLESRDCVGRSLIHLAVIYGHAGVVSILINLGAKVSSRMPDGRLCLHIACEYGFLDIAKMLWNKVLENKALMLHSFSSSDDKQDSTKKITSPDETPDVHDIDCYDWDYGFVPLHFAVLYGHGEVFEWLLSSGASTDINTKHPYIQAQIPIQLSWICYDVKVGLDIAMTLLQRNPEVLKIYRKYAISNIISEAIKAGAIDFLELCLKFDASIVDQFKYVLLMRELVNFQKPDVELVKFLLNNGALTFNDKQHFTVKSNESNTSNHWDTQQFEEPLQKICQIYTSHKPEHVEIVKLILICSPLINVEQNISILEKNINDQSDRFQNELDELRLKIEGKCVESGSITPYEIFLKKTDSQYFKNCPESHLTLLSKEIGNTIDIYDLLRIQSKTIDKIGVNRTLRMGTFDKDFFEKTPRKLDSLGNVYSYLECRTHLFKAVGSYEEKLPDTHQFSSYRELFQEIWKGDDASVEKLANEKNLKIACFNHRGETPLDIASIRRNLPMLKKLLFIANKQYSDSLPSANLAEKKVSQINNYNLDSLNIKNANEIKNLKKNKESQMSDVCLVDLLFPGSRKSYHLKNRSKADGLLNLMVLSDWLLGIEGIFSYFKETKPSYQFDVLTDEGIKSIEGNFLQDIISQNTNFAFNDYARLQLKESPFIYAVFSGKLEIVRYFIRESLGGFQMAAFHGLNDCIKPEKKQFNPREAYSGITTSKFKNYEIKNKKKAYWNFLNLAAAAGQAHIMEYFIGKVREDIEYFVKEKKDFDERAKELSDTKTFETFLAQICGIDQPKDEKMLYNESILHLIARKGSVDCLEVVRKSLSMNDFAKMINFEDKNGKTPLHYAVLVNKEITTTMFKYGANPLKKCTLRNWTPLHYLAVCNKYNNHNNQNSNEIMKQFLSMCSFDQSAELLMSNQSPLVLATYNGNHIAMKIIADYCKENSNALNSVNKEFDLMPSEYEHGSAVHVATKKNDVQALLVLKSVLSKTNSKLHEAWNSQDSDGLTPSMIALNANRYCLRKNYGVDILKLVHGLRFPFTYTNVDKKETIGNEKKNEFHAICDKSDEKHISCSLRDEPSSLIKIMKENQLMTRESISLNTMVKSEDTLKLILSETVKAKKLKIYYNYRVQHQRMIENIPLEKHWLHKLSNVDGYIDHYATLTKVALSIE